MKKKLTMKLLREAWIAGVKAQRAKNVAIARKACPEFEPPTHWTPPEEFRFAGSEYEAGMRAAAKVLFSL